MAKEKKRKNKNIKIAKKNHIWVTILLCLVIAVVSDASLFAFSSALATYIVDQKLVDEYESIEYLAKIYDKNTSGEDVFDILNEDGRTYFIQDKHGKIIYQNGNRTIGSTNGRIELPFTASDSGLSGREAYVRAYLDNSTEGFFEPDENGDIQLSMGSLVRFAIKVQEESNLNLDFRKSSFDLPVWLAVDVKNGTETFFGKASFSISLSDCMFILGFVLVGIAIVACIILLLLINMVSTIIAQRNMTTVLFKDPVTRGKNWIWYRYKGEKYLTRRKSASFMYAIVDVVFVKYRNYCVCHSVYEGEEMLCKVHKILNDEIKKKELASHYSSANFALMLRCKNKEELDERLNKLMEKLENIDSEHKFTFHFGVYILESEKDSKGKVVKRKKRNIDLEREYNNACTARDTLADCDDSGIAYYDEKLVEEQKWVEEVMNRFKNAIENEEFVVYYQPKYNPKTEELRGAEALIRWNCPDEEIGFKNPGSFIPILERNGAIPDIDHYMIGHVARDQKAWLDAGYECVPISVNVSRAHFIENDLADQIKEQVDKEGTPHNLIEIEVTESAFFDDKKAMIDTIVKLKEYGFMVSMDDFGSGYSSLNSLKDMPLDVLKLDAEFFRGDVNGGRGEKVVSEVLKLANLLEMVTVAEGVEERTQVKFLADHGCDMIQGYVYAKPMPADDYMLKMKRDPEAEKREEEAKKAEEASIEQEETTASEETKIETEN